MNKESENKSETRKFRVNLPEDFNFPRGAIERKLLKEYGAMLVAKDVTVPNRVVFKNEIEVAAFQSSVTKKRKNIGGFEIELQSAAMKKLKEAIAEAEENDLTITPRGTDAAKRTYSETIGLWASRVNPALAHWVEKGKLTEAEAEKVRVLSPFEQVSEILKLEERGIYFSKDLSKTIIYSVAPPGTSQHLSLLALDINEHGNETVREILAHHGWFQTVISDLPHFTFLGAKENELSGFGLKKKIDGGRAFWIPNL